MTIKFHENASLVDFLGRIQQTHTKAEIAKSLDVSPRTLRRWETGEQIPPAYVTAGLQKLLNFGPLPGKGGDFTFIDLFAGIGGIRLAFEAVGGECVFTSEWDSYAQKTYAENFPNGHLINGDITKIQAEDIPDHGGCTEFCVNGLMAGNRRTSRTGYDLKHKESSTQRSHR